MKILFSGGGSGGHIFPAVATIQALEVRGHDCVLVTDQSFKQWNSKRTDITAEYLSIIKNGAVKFLWSPIVSSVKSLMLLKKYKPDVVVCFGGYPTLPVLIAAFCLRVPIILHESNSVLGMTNKMFLPFAKKLAFFFPSIEVNTKKCYKEKLSLVGIPTTEEIRYVEYPKVKNKINILIIGGSQGARIFSRVVPQAMSIVAQIIDKEISISHQCPNRDIENVQKSYSGIGINAEVSTFFHDIAQKLCESHIVICRAGASTIAELLTIGRVGIYIPYPYAKADHQVKNTEFIIENNGGIVITQQDLTDEILAEQLVTLINDTSKLQEISRAAHNISITNSAIRFADLIQHVINSEGGGSGKV